MNKIDYYIHLELNHEFQMNTKEIVLKPVREEETSNRNLSDKFVTQLDQLRNANPHLLRKFVAISMEKGEFMNIIDNLITNKCTQDSFIKTKGGEPKLVMKEILIVQQIEDLGDATIELLCSVDFEGLKWDVYTKEIQRLFHEQLKRSGFVYDTQEKIIAKNDLAYRFIFLLKDTCPELLFKHFRNELVYYYFRVIINI